MNHSRVKKDISLTTGKIISRVSEYYKCSCECGGSRIVKKELLKNGSTYCCKACRLNNKPRTIYKEVVHRVMPKKMTEKEKFCQKYEIKECQLNLLMRNLGVKTLAEADKYYKNKYFTHL